MLPIIERDRVLQPYESYFERQMSQFARMRASLAGAGRLMDFANAHEFYGFHHSQNGWARKLFRSGESEYFINKTQCRLKDIIDLFLDTGIGTGGYSIIEQNKVEELVMANPETRREFFEEAAGVAKYKVRREDTLHRLKNIEIDLSRLEDSLKIFEGQIKQLDSPKERKASTKM